MTPQELIDSLERLDFNARWSHMRDLGRRALADAPTRALIAALAGAGDFYPRQLALMSAYGSGDRAILRAALGDASQLLAGMAVDGAVRHLDDDELADALRAAPRRRRKGLVAACARAGRQKAVTAAFDSFDAQERARFLPFAEEEFCAAQLVGDGAEALAAADWRALAGRHPHVVHREIAARIAAGGLSDPLTRFLPSIVDALSLRAADLALDLLAKAAPLDNFRPGETDDRRFLGRLATRFPREVADYFLHRPARTVPFLPRRLVAAVDPERRQKLYGLQARSAETSRRMAPELRAELYASEQFERERSREGALPVKLVALLPAAQRNAEGRRAWKATQLAAYPLRRLAYLAFLPFDEALSEAAPYLRQPDGELRAAANAALVGCGRFEARLQDILDHALARRNEQDPVRLALLRALGALPPSRWSDAHLPAIRALIAAALGAADASPATFAAALTWLFRLGLRASPPLGFIAECARPLIEKAGGAPAAESLLSSALTRALAPMLADVAEVWRGRSETGAILKLAASLGSRIEAAPELLDVVESLTADARRAVAEPALAFLSRLRRRQRFFALAPRLFQADPGWVLSPAVADFLDRRRQDLLADVLRPRLFTGRFSSGETRFLPSFGAGFARWTERQQATYAESVVSILRDAGRKAGTLAHLVAKLAEMPAIDIGALAQFAGVDAPDKALRDMALWSLGRADAARGAPELLRALGDERARIAIYALRRVVLDLRAAEALRLLAAVPLQPITVGKEAIRLAGDLRTREACDWLDALHVRDDLHADLRLAVLRAYWSFLERGQTWDALDAAARSDQLGLARAVVAVAQERLSPFARRRRAENQALLLAHPHALVRLEALRRIAAAPDRAGAGPLRGPLLAALEAGNVEAARLALSALISLGEPGVAEELAARCAAVADPVGFVGVVDTLQWQCALQRRGGREVAAALAQALTSRGRRLGAALRLALCAWPLETLPDWITAAPLHPDALLDALTTLRALAATPRGEALLGLEPALARAPQPWLRRLGLAIVGARAQAKGWTEDLRARLAAYDDDPDGWIAEARERIVPPPLEADGK